MNRSPKMALAALALALVAGIGLASAAGLPRPALLPRPTSSLVESHPVHAALRIDCGRCHVAAKTSRWASERLTPRMADCGGCHPAALTATALTPVTAACRACHGPLPHDAPPRPSFAPQPQLRFSHAAHQTMSCAACHKDSNPKNAVPAMPRMKPCYDCHTQRPGRADCRVCHIASADGRLVTQIAGVTLQPPAWLLGPSHGEGWAGDHAATAGRRSKLCGSCHEARFCEDCHSGALRPRQLHPGDWLRTHGTATRFDNPHCQGCHKTQGFCLTCHRRAGVASDSPAATKPLSGAGRTHGATAVPELMRRARRDITGCVACHNESSCISCHSLVKPHPAAWTQRCRKLAPRTETACRKCHAEGADRCR